MILAYVDARFHEPGVRKVLAESQDEFTAEALKQAADEFATMGLPRVADVVMEVASPGPSEAELCPYSPDDTANYKSWQAARGRHLRAGKRTTTGAY